MHLWDSELLREALARLDLGAVVAIIRTAAGLSQIGLGNLVDGWSQPTVSLTERGGRRGVYDLRKLFALVDAIGMPREALLPLILGRPDVSLRVDNDVYDLAGEKDVDRREFNGMAAGVLASALLPHIQVPERVDSAHVRYLQAALGRLRAWDQSMGGGAVLQQALRQFSRARRMLDESSYTEKVGRELLVLTSDLGVICGWAAYDHGEQQLARRLYSEAQLLANSSGDTELQAHVLVNMSMQSTYLATVDGARGFAREGLRLADMAGGVSRHETSPRLHALIALRQAAAYAQLGDGPAFRCAIAQARSELDRGSHPADPAWTGFVTAGEVAHALAAGYQRLGDPARAVTLHQDALEDPELSPRNRICNQGSLAAALLAAGDRVESINTGRAILPALAGGKMTSARPLVRLKAVRAAAGQDGDEEFCVRFDSVSRSLAS
jgi:transcriptional regulator with XRE-family HTH domain